MSTPLKIAVVGAGGMGRRTARALANDPAWELVAISDLKPEVRAAVAEDFTDVRVIDDTPGILADPAIDAVAITTLADIRPLLVKEALVQGKHIWAEKPQNRSPPASKTKRNCLSGSKPMVCMSA